jgi:hypothetical protein
MRRSEWLVRGLLIFCLIYGVSAWQKHPIERFPFFSWDLFSNAPDPHQTDYSIRLLDPTNLPRNTYFEDANLQPRAQEVQALTLMKAWGQTIDANDTAGSQYIRKAFQDTYLNGVPGVRYQVVRRTFEIRKRVECPKCFDDQVVIGTFTNG